MAKRGAVPPYEIMGRKAIEGEGEEAGSVGAAERATPAAAATEGEPVGRPGVGSVAMAGLSEPVVLRVPRGLAILAVAGMIGLVIAGYGVGHSRGVGAGLAEAEAEAQAEQEMIERMVRRQIGNPARPSSDKPAGADPARFEDRRVRGLNYFVVSLSPPEEATRLVAFMSRQGVDATAVPSDDPRFVKVIALQGFTAAELRSPTARDYEEALRAIGRRWREANGGGKDLSDLYAELYRG
ncbi:MAG: hypothetical protein AAF823_08795 [Planctomycetota bacterium]